ncbi:hypothetical protein PLICRDRAFT_173963 [Plicaturopsis crispa FD-325 SS-3]|nr:hypothetical protein PLICRDRAFT_173963 [Plicaturopsis crispa FD-325 SS-3]
MTSEDPPTFPARELQRALSEQAFGITGFQMMPASTPLDASAYVTLLEGNVIKITLSARGYQVCASPSTSDKRWSQIFENVEDLLERASAAYAAKRQEALVKRLEQLP